MCVATGLGCDGWLEVCRDLIMVDATGLGRTYAAQGGCAAVSAFFVPTDEAALVGFISQCGLCAPLLHHASSADLYQEKYVFFKKFAREVLFKCLGT